MDGAVWRSLSRCSACGCSHRPRPRQRGRSSSASSRGPRSMTPISRGWPPPRSGRTVSCSIGGGCSPRQGSFNWGGTDRFIGRLASHGIRAAPALWGNPDWVYGSPARPPLNGRQAVQAWQRFLRQLAARYGSHGSYWANGYRQRFGARAKPLPIRSWQIWNEPNLTKYFAPAPIAPRVRAAAPDLRRGDQEPGSVGPDRARGNARPRGHGGLGLPRQALLGDRNQGRTSTPPPCTRTPAASTASASTSSGSAR